MAGFWQGKKVLVTGANGFIGGWLCKALVEQGADVYGTVFSENKMFEEHGIQGRVKTFGVDLGISEEIEAAFSQATPKICFHLAAKSTSEQVAENAKAAMNVNVEGTKTVLDAAEKYKSAVVFVSSVKVYGSFTKECFGEEDELKGEGLYAESKIKAEFECAGSAVRGTSVGIARLGNVYGGFDPNNSRLVPSMVRRMLKGVPASIKGEGKNSQDFVYVEDVVKGLLLLGEKALKKKLEAEAFNFGSGKTHSVLEIVEKLGEVGGNAVRPNFFGEEQAGRELLCIEKAERELGWKPAFSLEEGLKKTIELYRG
jgi:CDP-glucose 4,6-dehydratase